MGENVLVLAALSDATGNAVTARRIASHLQATCDVCLVDANATHAEDLRHLVARREIRAALGVHALLAGPFLRALGIPYALLFGGTDLYEPTHDLQRVQMSHAVGAAARLLAFSAENRARGEWMWPDISGRIRLVPQAVELPPTVPFSLRARLNLSARDVVVLLPTGIRKVKDPLHTVEAFGVWHALQPNVHLVVVGAIIEPDYAEDALAQLGDRPGIHYVSALSRAELVAAMREADVVLNTSLSEGMCGTVLEAMAVGAPVVARRNAGNESLVAHGSTGLLYDTPNELVHWVSALTRSGDLRAHLAQSARRRIEAAHAPALERDAYVEVMRDVIDAARTRAVPACTPRDPMVHVPATARGLGVDAVAIEALGSMLERMTRDEALAGLRRDLSGLLGTAPPSIALAHTRRRVVEHGLSAADARTLYLLLALVQVPDAAARHRARGIDAAVSEVTLGDLAVWSRGLRGLSFDSSAWSQRYLRGELLQFGGLQFDLRPFPAPMHVYRSRAGALAAVSLDGRPIDLASGNVLDASAPPHLSPAWSCVIEPGTPMLEMWVPGNNVITMPEMTRALREAYSTFGRVAPETVPVGVYGESWRLDPQVLSVLPTELGVHALQKVVSLYPSALSEARTLRRLFGPDSTRPTVAALDASTLDPLRAGVARLLRDPAVTLRARCGFALRVDIESMPDWKRP
ncbi:MAG: glycosyltransferase [Polyangiaceae bacterium]